MMRYKFLLEQAKEGYKWYKVQRKISNETDLLLIVFIVLICVYSACTGLDYLTAGRVGLGIFSVVVIVANTVNFVFAVQRMIRRRKEDKSSLAFWEAEIKSLEELMNEDAESEMDIP